MTVARIKRALHAGRLAIEIHASPVHLEQLVEFAKNLHALVSESQTLKGKESQRVVQPHAS